MTAPLPLQQNHRQGGPSCSAPCSAAALAALLLLGAGSRPAAAETAEAAVARVFSRISENRALARASDARAIREQDLRIAALAPELLRLGPTVVAPLAAIAQDPSRPAKTRAWAVSFLGRGRDPGAFAPLRRLLLEPSHPDAVRSAAAFALADIDVRKQAKRRALCAALEEPPLPPLALRETLAQTAELGCANPEVLERRAKSFGLRPGGSSATLVRLAIKGLGRSQPAEAGRALLRLLAFFPSGSSHRGEALDALWEKREDLLLFRLQALNSVLAALEQESTSPANAVKALRIAAFFKEPSSVLPLLRFLDNEDAEVVAAAAEALSSLGAAQARAPLESLLSRVHEDERFAPRAESSDPRGLVERIERALKGIP